MFAACQLAQVLGRREQPLVLLVIVPLQHGADAVGYTLYVGSPPRSATSRSTCGSARTPNGSGCRSSCGPTRAARRSTPRDSFYAVDYAVRIASELGADLVKANFPQPGKQSDVPQPYHREFSAAEAIAAVVRSANRSLLLVFRGEQAGDEAMLEKARQSLKAALPA